MATNFSDYIVYVDESGDHGLKTIDPNYPVFVLVFCIFHKSHFIEKIVPAIQGFKFKHRQLGQALLKTWPKSNRFKRFEYVAKPSLLYVLL
ncbi:MAG: hypothetical protein ACI8XX_002318 [Polaribacter sp.]|jgi:hypothetical protein